jgi:hypothetical protein
MPVSTISPTENVMANMTSRVGAYRLNTGRVGFAPRDTDSDQAGRYVWMETQGPKALDSALTWTTTQS